MAVVYRHRRLDNNKIFYIGISNNLRRPYRTDGRNDHWQKIYKKVGFSVDILIDNITIDEAKELEIFLIEEYGRVDLGNGPLVNKTTGGEFFNHSEETKNKIRESKIGDKNHRYGKKQTQKQKEQLKISNTGRKKSEEEIKIRKENFIKKGLSRETCVYYYDTMELIGIYPSLSDACRAIGLDVKKFSGKASMIANNKGRNHVNNFHFSFTTNKSNYKAFSEHLGKSEILTNPDLVATDYSFESAIFFFDKNKLWTIADKGVNDAAILAITKKINGGTNGLDDRSSLTKRYYSWLTK